MRYVFVILVALMFNGCLKDVKPWEKNILAKASMQDGDLNALTQRFEEHIYFSKEGTKGGGNVSGGGCGCN